MAESLEIMDGPLEADDQFNLTVVRSTGSIVMGRKLRGYGKGRLVLPGGKSHYYLGSGGIAIVPGPYDASRELFEETGIDTDVRSLSQVGLLNIATEEDIKSVAIYEAHTRKVALHNTAELTDLDWYAETSLPYNEMPKDYKLWLPHILAGYAVTAYFETYNDDLVDATIYRQQQNPLSRAERLAVDVSMI